MYIKSLLIAGMIAIPVPVFSQQVTNYSVCTNYQENYVPGYYDRYGNYVQGTVNTQRNIVPCSRNYPTSQSNNCSSSKTILGGVLGGGIAAAVSKKDSWSWAIPLGTVLGAGAANSTCQ